MTERGIKNGANTLMMVGLAVLLSFANTSLPITIAGLVMISLGMFTQMFFAVKKIKNKK